MRSMVQMRPRVSYADLERWPADGRRVELYDGVPVEMPSPTLRHQRVVFNVAEILREYERRVGGLMALAPVDVVLTDYDVVQPDVLMFGPTRSWELDPSKPIRRAPDLAVEVLSPSTVRTDRGRKVSLLARHHVGEDWLVDPDGGTVEQRVLEQGEWRLTAVLQAGDTLRAVVLAGLSAAVATIFAD